MMSKNSLFGFLGLVVSLIFTINFVSAATFTLSDLSKPSTIIENQTANFSFNVTYTGSSENMNISFSNSNVNFGTLYIQNATNLNGTVSESVIIYGNVTGLSGRGSQNLIVTINGTTTGGSQDSISFTVPVTSSTQTSPGSFCKFGKKGDLKLAEFVITNLGTGDDEEWNLLDEIEIEIEIENTNRNDRIDDVIAQIKILDSGGNDLTEDFGLDDDEIDIGRIKARDSEVITFKISELPADLKEDKYKIYIKAFSENDEDLECIDSSADLNENNYNEIEIIRENDPAVIVKSNTLKLSTTCNEKNFLANFDIINLGSDDEKKVLITLENKELGISEKQVIENLKSGKKKEITFTMNIPAGLEKSFYDLVVRTYFDYDRGDETETTNYDESSDDINYKFAQRLEVLNCQAISPQISAKLNSESKVGENLVISVTIKNTANTQKNLTLSLTDYESWAELVSIDPQTAVLKAEETKDFVVTITPD
ncbi:MAG: putative S-layer protein, partial [Nanoarchaeota archaeon]|nr:putative S-layer protein [Nanoarchaeota archaeon]